MFKRQIIIFLFFVFLPALALIIFFAPLRTVGTAINLFIAFAVVFLIARLVTWPFYYFSDMLPKWLNSLGFILTGAAFLVIWAAMLYQRYFLWGEGGDAVSFILNNMFQGHRVMINDIIQSFSGYDMGMSFFTIESQSILEYYLYALFIFASASTGFILSRAELKANEDFETDTVNYTTDDFVRSEVKDNVQTNYYKRTERELTFRRSWTPGQIYMLIMWVFLALLFYFPLFTVVIMMIYAIVRLFNSMIVKLILTSVLLGGFLLFFFFPSYVFKGYQPNFSFRQIFYGDGKLIYRVGMKDALEAIKTVDKNKQTLSGNYVITIREISTPLDILSLTSYIEKAAVKGTTVTKFTINDNAIAPQGIYYLVNQGGKNKIIYLKGDTKETFQDGTEKYKSLLSALNNFNFNAITNTKYYLESKEAYNFEAKTRNGLMYIVYYYSKRDFWDNRKQLSPNLAIKDGRVAIAEMEVDNRAYRFYISYGNANINMDEIDEVMKK